MSSDKNPTKDGHKTSPSITHITHQASTTNHHQQQQQPDDDAIDDHEIDRPDQTRSTQNGTHINHITPTTPPAPQT
jgi:hypothetical protein